MTGSVENSRCSPPPSPETRPGCSCGSRATGRSGPTAKPSPRTASRRIDGGRALVLDHVARQQMPAVGGGVEHHVVGPALDAALERRLQRLVGGVAGVEGEVVAEQDEALRRGRGARPSAPAASRCPRGGSRSASGSARRPSSAATAACAALTSELLPMPRAPHSSALLAGSPAAKRRVLSSRMSRDAVDALEEGQRRPGSPRPPVAGAAASRARRKRPRRRDRGGARRRRRQALQRSRRCARRGRRSGSAASANTLSRRIRQGAPIITRRACSKGRHRRSPASLQTRPPVTIVRATSGRAGAPSIERICAFHVGYPGLCAGGGCGGLGGFGDIASILPMFAILIFVIMYFLVMPPAAAAG